MFPGSPPPAEPRPLMQRAPARLLVVAAVALLATVLAGWDKDEDRSRRLDPQPAFYLTAANPTDLKRQAYAAGARFARGQGPGRSVLMLDFGAARLRRDGTYGATLRSGTFFSNEEIRHALRAAARGLEDHHRRGRVTIVYANSNAFLGRPGRRYRAFNVHRARKAGKQQAKTVAGLRLPGRHSASAGGDIEPGYDRVGKPEVSIAMVAGAASTLRKEPYFNVGTAPCERQRCENGWTPRDICEVASGRKKVVLPEIYFDRSPVDQPQQWAEMKKRCEIGRFAGVSSSRVGRFSPRESWNELRGKTGARVDPVIVVWPG
jgi:hypothetical protein